MSKWGDGVANSNITKRAIAAAFRQLLDTTSFDRITVTAIASQCGINRQTFYYHFRDIYDLVGWIVEDRVVAILGTDTYSVSNNGVRIIEASLLALKDEQELVSRLAHSTDPILINHIMQTHLISVIEDVLKQICQGSELAEEDKRLITTFFVGGYLNTIYDWITNGMRDDPVSLANRLATVLCSGLHAAIPHLSQK